MKKRDAIKFFGSQAKLAKRLGISSQAVDQWGKIVPDLRQLQLEYITDRQLRATDKARGGK